MLEIQQNQQTRSWIRSWIGSWMGSGSGAAHRGLLLKAAVDLLLLLLQLVAELLLGPLLLLLQEAELPQLLAPEQEEEEEGVSRSVCIYRAVRRTEGGAGEDLRNLISSFFVSLSVTIFDVVTLTSTPSTMNFRVFFSVFFCRLMSWKRGDTRFICSSSRSGYGVW